MACSPEEQEAILSFVKREPRTVQEVAEQIGRSWVTAEKYVQEVAERTGLVRMKVFRPGTRGALKLCFYNFADRPLRDELEKELYKRVRAGRVKRDAPFFDIYQWADPERKRARTEPLDSTREAKVLLSQLRSAEQQLLVCSGNLSVLSVTVGKTSVLDILEELAAKNVTVRVLTSLTLGSLRNASPLLELQGRYDTLEVRHAYQPLRGFLIDGRLARFTDEETQEQYRDGELARDVRIVYELEDADWLAWLDRVFWNLYRTAIDGHRRVRELQRLEENA